MRRNLRLFWLLVVTIPLIALVNVKAVHSDDTTLYLDPDIGYAALGESFTVDVKVVDIPDETTLYSWQVHISFDSSILELVQVTEGDFLKEQPEGTIASRQMKTDWALFGWSTKGKHPGVSGDGTLATVEFNVVGTGKSVLNITSDFTYLLEFRPPPVPPGEEPLKDIPFTPENGFFTNLEVPPTASFTYSPSLPGIGETLTFDASASSDPDGTIVSYEWDFGDDESVNMTIATVTHVYDAPGTYTVTLKVVDDSEMSHKWFELHSTATEEVLVRSTHDVAVVDVTTSAATVTVGDSVSIDVTVSNEGTVTESFSVKAYYADNIIGAQQVTELSSGASTTLTFTWDTSDVSVGTYTIGAEATEVEGEIDLDDNAREDGTVRVALTETSFPNNTLVVAAAVIVVVLTAEILWYRRRRPMYASPSSIKR